jgi:hypothetical protein
LIGADAPTDTMRDPFVAASPLPTITPAVSSTPPLLPAAPQVNPTAPPVPGLGEIKPLPLPGGGLPSLTTAAGQPSNGAPSQASWQVTGIIQSDADPRDSVAILRNGDEHRYLKLGDQLDDETRLIGIDTDSITLLRDGQRIQLGVSSIIGGQPAPTAAVAPASPSPSIVTSAQPISFQPEVVPRKTAPEPNSSSSPYPAHYAHDAAD